MTAENAERGAEELLPCPNMGCRNSAVHFIATGASSADEGYISCPFCGMSGPMADTEAEAGHLWNALPRPTTDTVERAEVAGALDWYAEKVAACRKVTIEGDAARRDLDRDGGERARSAIRALPSAAGGGVAELREALRNILGWRELRSGADEVPISRIEDIARAALNPQGEK